MCTASWIHYAEGYQLYFNRDEKLTRLPAHPPELAERDGVLFLSPVDGDSSGTWIATNEFGLSVCLFNGANLTSFAGADPNPITSRGLLIPRIIPSRSIAALNQRLEEVSLIEFAPFTLAALGPGQPALLFEWDGNRRTIRLQEEPHFLLTSSSFDTEAVRASRHQEYRNRIDTYREVNASLLAELHASHLPKRGPYSICMHRPDAKTVSFSRVVASSHGTDFFYSPAAPCEQAKTVHLFLHRRTANIAESME